MNWVKLLLCLNVCIFMSAAQEDEVRILIDKAGKNARNPAVWAKYLMQADAAAEKLERSEPGGCCRNRCLTIGAFELHYRYNSLSGQEDYQHDILQMIAITWEGTPQGAEALIRLLPTGCQTIGSVWTPYFQSVLSILELKKWKDVHDFRLTRMRAEAYETWWSLSKLTADDALVSDFGYDPADFAEGSAVARQRAIEGYELLVKSGHSDKEVAESLAKLKAGEDKEMRKWVCASD